MDYIVHPSLFIFSIIIFFSEFFLLYVELEKVIYFINFAQFVKKWEIRILLILKFTVWLILF